MNARRKLTKAMRLLSCILDVHGSNILAKSLTILSEIIRGTPQSHHVNARLEVSHQIKSTTISFLIDSSSFITHATFPVNESVDE